MQSLAPGATLCGATPAASALNLMVHGCLGLNSVSFWNLAMQQRSSGRRASFCIELPSTRAAWNLCEVERPTYGFSLELVLGILISSTKRYSPACPQQSLLTSDLHLHSLQVSPIEASATDFQPSGPCPQGCWGEPGKGDSCRHTALPSALPAALLQADPVGISSCHSYPQWPRL